MTMMQELQIHFAAAEPILPSKPMQGLTFKVVLPFAEDVLKR